MVEHWIEDPGVGGSNPSRPTYKGKTMPKKKAVKKTAAKKDTTTAVSLPPVVISSAITKAELKRLVKSKVEDQLYDNSTVERKLNGEIKKALKALEPHIQEMIESELRKRLPKMVKEFVDNLSY